jgi:PTH1 family peptidyl-tRNA hydrolase
MKLLVGLGNPGARYARQRHNVGFMALDAIMARHGLGPGKRRFQGEAVEGRIGGTRILALKPQTYMNESGRAVAAAARFYRIGAGDIIVLHDEIDLAAGRVRVKRGGGTAGHNGLRSIAAQLGPDFTRVRIGIGHPGLKDQVHSHVLGDFSKADGRWLEPLLDAIADNAAVLVAGDDANFMNALAGAGKPRPGTRTPPAPAKAPRARARRSGGEPRQPSQRDLARAAARPARSRSREAAPDDPADPAPGDRGARSRRAGGPFQLLRRLFARTQGPDPD